MAGIGGTSGNDSLTGTAGSDSVYGGAGGGADTVTGGSGGDRLAGGTGDDSLSGGGGDDTFVLADGSGDDVVGDFELGALASPRDLFDVSNLCDADGNPVNWRDVTVSDDGLGNAILSFPGGESVLMLGIRPDAIDDRHELRAAGIPCFTPGTLIRTPKGAVAVETLAPGNLVVTADDGPRPVPSPCRRLPCARSSSRPARSAMHPRSASRRSTASCSTTRRCAVLPAVTGSCAPSISRGACPASASCAGRGR